MTSIDLTDTARSQTEAAMLQPLDLAPARPLEEEIIARASGNYDPLPMLDVIFGRLVTAYAPMLKSQLGVIGEVSAHEVIYQPWAQAVEGLDPLGVVCAATSSWGGDILLAFDSPLLHGAIGMMLGGNPGPEDVPLRAPTTLEKAFALSLVKESLGQLAQHISRIVEVQFTPDAVEAPAQVSSFHAGTSVTAACILRLQIGRLSGQATFLMPMQTLEPVRPQLGKMFLGDELGVDQGWRKHFEGQIAEASTQVTAELHRLSLPLADVLRWQIGATIDLGVTEDHEATLYCSGYAILQGATGRKRNGRMALRITHEVAQNPTGGEDDLLLD